MASTARIGRSRTVDLDGRIHFVDFGGEGPSVVLVHGLGGSHVNWLAAVPLLARVARAVAIDLVAFGRTPPKGRSASVVANAELQARFIKSAVGGAAVVVGNSIGGRMSLLT